MHATFVCCVASFKFIVVCIIQTFFSQLETWMGEVFAAYSYTNRRMSIHKYVQQYCLPYTCIQYSVVHYFSQSVCYFVYCSAMFVLSRHSLNRGFNRRERWKAVFNLASKQYAYEQHTRNNGYINFMLLQYMANRVMATC